MKKIRLNQRPSKSHQNYWAIVDDEDYERVNELKWSVLHGHTGILYAQNNPDNKKPIYMHRMVINATDGTIVDHKNGNGLDNRRENLRICTHSENAINSRMFKHNTSGHKGIYWDKPRKKWAAQIMVSKKHIYLGRYENLQDALKARKEGEVKYFGNFL